MLAHRATDMAQRIGQHIGNQFGGARHFDVAIVEPRHRQQIFHQIDQPIRVLMDIRRQTLPLRLVQDVPRGEQHIGVARDARERRSQIMGNGTQQIRAQRLLLGLDGEVLPLARQRQSLRRLTAFVKQRYEQIALEGAEVVVALLHHQSRHAEHAILRTNGKVQAARLAQGVRRRAGSLAIGGDPRRNGHLARSRKIQLLGVSPAAAGDIEDPRRKEAAMRRPIDLVHHHRPIENLHHLGRRRLQTSAEAHDRLELPTALQKHLGTVGPSRRRRRLTLQPDGQRRGPQCSYQQNREDDGSR